MAAAGDAAGAEGHRGAPRTDVSPDRRPTETRSRASGAMGPRPLARPGTPGRAGTAPPAGTTGAGVRDPARFRHSRVWLPQPDCEGAAGADALPERRARGGLRGAAEAGRAERALPRGRG